MNYFLSMGRLRAELRAARTMRQRRSPRIGRVGLEELETRALLSSTLESIDGTGNNTAKPLQGSAGTDLIRVSPVAYADGVSSPALPNNPSARVLSDVLNNQAVSPRFPRTLRPSTRTAFPTSATCSGSSWTTTWTSPLQTRAKSCRLPPIPTIPATWGTRRSSVRRTIRPPAPAPVIRASRSTSVTSYLDLSQVYGSTAATGRCPAHAFGRSAQD